MTAHSLQQQSATSSRMMASFIHDGGRSSSVTAINGLNTLKLWRTRGAVQNVTTVSIGGHPGNPHATSATDSVQSAGKANRSRVQSATRVAADECSAVRFDRLITIARRRYGAGVVEVN
jgi:hypothetical protein